MAQYEGTFACGHEGKVSVGGPVKKREWKIKKQFEGVCPECHRKKIEEKRQKEKEDADQKTSEWNLPPLTGTEKQIPWATVLRVKIIEEIAAQENEEREFRDLLSWTIHNHKEASFWINSRGIQTPHLIYSIEHELEMTKKQKKISAKKLRGSEKQISWAKQIQFEGIDLCEKYTLSFAKKKFESIDSAEWFIENWAILGEQMTPHIEFDAIYKLIDLNIQEEIKKKENGGEISIEEERYINTKYNGLIKELRDSLKKFNE